MQPIYRCTHIGAFLGVAALLGTSPPVAFAQTDIRLDHFKCYFAEQAPVTPPPGDTVPPPDTFPPGDNFPPVIPPIVQLQDQFDIAAQRFERTLVGPPVRFCNPVTKIHKKEVSEIRDRKAHLKMYLTAASTLHPPRRVEVANQFGKQKLTVYNPEVLAVPTEKNNEGPPDKLDHYKCYRAFGKAVKAKVTLRDQFHLEEDVRVGRPFGFCNPTRKLHAGQAFGVNNARDHLVCYRIGRRPFTGTLTTTNQFGFEQLIVSNADLLCVPSAKLKWGFVQDPAHADDIVGRP